jgi:hypothetical protein
MGITYLNHWAQIKCVHGGTVQLFPPVDRSYYTAGAPIVTDCDLLQAKVVCPLVGPGLKPCTTMLAILEGECLEFEVDGETPILDTLKAMTDSNPPGFCFALTNGGSNTDALGTLSLLAKFAEVLRRTLPKLPSDMRAAFKAFVSPDSLGILAALAGLHMSGQAEIAEAFAGLLLLMFGAQIWGDIEHLLSKTYNARNVSDLEEAAKHLAHATATVGAVSLFTGLARVTARLGETGTDPFYGNKAPFAGEIESWAKKNGWKRTQTEGGPIKYIDENGIPRVTIKRGSPRTPGSENPHVELRNSKGKRVDPQGKEVNRRSAANHTPIKWDF